MTSPKDEALAHMTLITKLSPSIIPNRYTMRSKMKTQQPDDHADGSQQDRALFQKARDHLNPGPFFRFVTYFYAERKIAVFLLIHAVCTLVVWGKLHTYRTEPDTHMKSLVTHMILLYFLVPQPTMQ
jgi:hypothetical protein